VEFNCKNGKVDGIYKLWNWGEQIAIEIYFKDGKLDGKNEA